jgi:hypothetical protein
MGGAEIYFYTVSQAVPTRLPGKCRLRRKAFEVEKGEVEQRGKLIRILLHQIGIFTLILGGRHIPVPSINIYNLLLLSRPRWCSG